MKEYRDTPSPEETGLLQRIISSTRNFFSTLFDFSFSRFITVQMFPLLYGLILAATLVEAIYLTIEAFITGWGKGLFYLFIALFIAIVIYFDKLLSRKLQIKKTRKKNKTTSFFKS